MITLKMGWKKRVLLTNIKIWETVNVAFLFNHLLKWKENENFDRYLHFAKVGIGINRMPGMIEPLIAGVVQLVFKTVPLKEIEHEARQVQNDISKINDDNRCLQETTARF